MLLMACLPMPFQASLLLRSASCTTIHRGVSTHSSIATSSKGPYEHHVCSTPAGCPQARNLLHIALLHQSHGMNHAVELLQGCKQKRNLLLEGRSAPICTRLATQSKGCMADERQCEVCHK